jgi:peroxiredoxin
MTRKRPVFMRRLCNLTSIVLCCGLIVALLEPAIAQAQIGSCSVSLSPQTVNSGSDTFFSFSLYTTDGSAINWMQVTSPGSSYVTIESASASNWQTNIAGDTATFTGGNVPSGYGVGLTVEALASNTAAGPISWQVQASDSADGSNPTTCDGDTSFTIVQVASTINISNVAATSVTDNSATITWNTDVQATSEVNYGQNSTSEHSTGLDNTLVNNHRATLSGLSPETGYLFDVVSTTPDGGSASSDGNTFQTSAAPSPTPTPTPTPSPSPTASPTPSPTVTPTSAPKSSLVVKVTNTTDKTPPSISLTAPKTNIFKTPPTLSGNASDNISIQRVEYSTDGGKDWLPVDTAPGLNTPKTSFSFTPLNLDDGTYAVITRATDAGGNIAMSNEISIVIDRLPPIIGGNIMSIGTQLLTPDATGTVTVPTGLSEKVALNTVGGPVAVVITATAVSGSQKPVQFHLMRSASTGLWNGIMSFGTAGTYHLSANAVDGAGTQTSRELNTVIAEAAGRVTDTHTGKLLPAHLTVYDRDPDTNSWVVWDGATYGQANPSWLMHGSYSLFLTPGTYYLEFSSDNHQTVVSESFTLHKTTILADNVAMHGQLGIHVAFIHLTWPTLTPTPLAINGQTPSGRSNTPVILGKSLPNFSLPLTNGQTLTNIDLLGKPTIVTMVGTWAPPAQDQLGILNQLNNSELNIVPIAIGESAAKLSVYNKIAGYSVPVLADSDQQLVTAFGITSLPTTYFVDRHGVVKRVMVGVLSTEELLANVQY